MDLAGNTFWELHLHDSLSRPRRIAQPGHKRLHHSDMKISPQWHQWLRHTRDDAPTVQEQLSDVQRLANIKRLARIADERWASKRRPPSRRLPEGEEPPARTGSPRLGVRVQARRSSNYSRISSTLNLIEWIHLALLLHVRLATITGLQEKHLNLSSNFLSRVDRAQHPIRHANAHFIHRLQSVQPPTS